MRLLYTLIFTLLMVVVVRASLPPEPNCSGFVVNNHNRVVSWSPRIPVRIYLDNSVSAEYQQIILDAAEVWNAAAGRKIIDIIGFLSNRNISGTDHVNMIYFEPSLPQGKDNLEQQAVTTIIWDGSDIMDATTRVSVEKLEQLDAESLFIHEFGHVLGMKHSEVKDSVMSAYLDHNQERRNLTQSDMSNVRCIYAQEEEHGN